MRLENRIPPPLVMVLIGLAMWAFAGLPPALPGGWLRTLLAVVFLLGGVFVVGLGVAGFRAAGTTIDPTRPERAQQLVVVGIYRLTRNPMYLGFAMILLSWALQLGSTWTLAGPTLFVLYIGRFQIAPEERALSARFGDSYLAYQKRVRRWV